MSLKKIDEVKKDRGFKIFDLIIYGVVALFVAVTFIVIFTTRDTSPASGIRVYSDNAVVFEYNFKDGKHKNLNKDRVEVLSEDDKTLEIKVTFDGGHNTVLIDKSGRVTVKDADCFGKTCMAMEIKDKSGMIYCSPHRLRIEPYNFSPGNDVTV